MSGSDAPSSDRRSAEAGVPRAPAPLDGVERLIVLMPSWVGDVTMATPLLRALRRALPRARIAALLRPGLSALLDGLPFVDERFTAPMRGAAGPWTGVRPARAFRADAVLLLPNSVRSGLAALALAPRRIGYRTPGRGWTLTHACPAPPRGRPVPAVDFYAELGAWALGRAITDRRPELVATDEERRSADALLDGAGAASEGRRWLLVNPGANRIDKRWPADRFAEAAARIALRHHLEIAVTGAPSERALVAEVAERASALLAGGSSAAALGAGSSGTASTAGAADTGRRVVDLAARGVTLGSLKGVLVRSALLLTNDTGPRHLAAALGTPSIVLFGPTDHRWTTLRWEDADGAERRVDRLLLSEPFLPDDRVADQLPGVCRIDRISVGDATDAARTIMVR